MLDRHRKQLPECIVSGSSRMESAIRDCLAIRKAAHSSRAVYQLVRLEKEVHRGEQNFTESIPDPGAAVVVRLLPRLWQTPSKRLRFSDLIGSAVEYGSTKPPFVASEPRGKTNTCAVDENGRGIRGRPEDDLRSVKSEGLARSPDAPGREFAL